MFYLFPRKLHTDLSKKRKTAYCNLFQLITDNKAFSVGATIEIGLKHSKIFYSWLTSLMEIIIDFIANKSQIIEICSLPYPCSVG